jgi:hypothetical protein
MRHICGILRRLATGGDVGECQGDNGQKKKKAQRKTEHGEELFGADAIDMHPRPHDRAQQRSSFFAKCTRSAVGSAPGNIFCP